MSFDKREKVVLYRMNFGWSVSWSETFIIDTFLKGLFGGFLLVFFEKILHAFFQKVINRTVQINGELFDCFKQILIEAGCESFS